MQKYNNERLVLENYENEFSYERNKSNKGQFIDMTLYDSALALMHPHNANYFLTKKPGKATGNSNNQKL